MKKILLAICLLTGFASCNTKDAGSPSASVDGMFNAMKQGNIDDMKKYITKADVNMMDGMENMMKNVNPEALAKIKEKVIKEMKEKAKDVTYSLKNEKVDGDNATVEAEVVENGKKTSHNLALVKEDGAWKISLRNPGNEMFNSMKGNLGSEKKELDDALEKIKSIPPDSLKAMMDSLSKRMERN